MIQAILFDLDGTLVRTEHLKALSYARALDALEPGVQHERRVAALFPDVMGMSREAVADHLVACLGIASMLQVQASIRGLETPRDVLLDERLRVYRALVAEPGILMRYRNKWTVDLLRRARAAKLCIGLASGAPCDTITKVLHALELADSFDTVVSGDEVQHNKPAPDVYRRAAEILGVDPSSCLAIEDSRVGVEAAVTAGAKCIAVTTPFTRRSVHESGLLDDAWIVDTAKELLGRVRTLIDQEMPLGGTAPVWGLEPT